MSNIQPINEDLKIDVEKIAKGGGISLAGSVIGKVLFFFVQIAIVRLLGSEVYGLYVLGLAVARLVEITSRFGLDFGSMKFVSRYHEHDAARVKGTIFNSFGVPFLTGMFMGAFLYLGSGFISEFFFHKPELKESIRYLAICVPFMSTTHVLASATQGFQTTKYAVLIKEIAQPAANFLFVIIFSLSGFGLKGVLYAFNISYLLAFILSIYLLSKIYRDSVKERLKPVFEIRTLLVYSTPLIFVSVVTYLLAWTDILLLGHFVSVEDVSVYKAASLVSFLLLLVLNASNSIYAPVTAELFCRGQNDRFEEVLKISTRWIFNITLPVLIIIIFSSRMIMAIFGTEFIGKGAPLLIILSVAQFINCATGGVGLTLIMTGKQKLETFNSVLQLIMNIVLNYMMIPKYGLLGAAIATGTAVSFINILRLAEVYYIHGIHPYNRYYYSSIACACISITILYFLSSFSRLSDLSLYVLGNSAVIGTFLISFMLSKKTAEDDHILFMLKTKILKLVANGR